MTDKYNQPPAPRQQSPSSETGATPCREDGRCQYAIDHGTEGLAVCPVGKCASPAATPRTDALERVAEEHIGERGAGGVIHEYKKLARTLERERDEKDRQLTECYARLDAALKASPSATAAISSPVEEGAIWNEAIEAAAKQIEPGYQRGCDCEFCDCGNRGDAQRVATWDSDTIGAAMIRKLKRHDMKREQDAPRDARSAQE